jgi:uncharacterized membrane protein
MSITNIALLAVLAVLVVLYLARRRSRMTVEDLD